MIDPEQFSRRFARIRGVVAVALGGSRATGQYRPDSNWDFGLYYRGRIDTGDVRALGYPGHVAEPGEWGRLVNGGAWLSVGGVKVDLLYRDLDTVEHWLGEAEEGRFEVDNVAGHIVGLPTYVLAGELAVGKVLHGSLPRPSYPEALSQSAPPWWLGNAAFSLAFADGYAARGEVAACAGSLSRAAFAVAHARLAARREWALNEKGMLQRAGLAEANHLLSGVGSKAEHLAATVSRMREMLGLGRPTGCKADEIVPL